MTMLMLIEKTIIIIKFGREITLIYIFINVIDNNFKWHQLKGTYIDINVKEVVIDVDRKTLWIMTTTSN